MRSRRANITIGLLFPSTYTAVFLVADALLGRRIFWRPPATYAHLLVLVAIPILLLLFRSQRLLGAALLFGASLALALLFYAEPIRYRFEWRHRSETYMSDLLNASPDSVSCRFTESTKISLACEVRLTAGQLEELSHLSGAGEGRFESCSMTKGDPCSQITGYCEAIGRKGSGVEVYDLTHGENMRIIEAHRKQFSSVLMLENLYLDREKGKACIVVNTGGSDQMRC